MAAASSSSSSSSHLHQIKYDVFISFRGSDIRDGFLSHLKKELHQKHIDAYVDERLQRGDEISSALLEAIDGSQISLIIFSKDYASSKWCLEELVKIIECKEVNDQIVIPVFYNVDPSHVRHQKGTYGEAFAQHEQKYNYNNMEKLQSWRSALNKAANLSGYHYPSNFENESKLIDEIVKDILKKLDDIYPIDDSKRLIGFERNLAYVESLLEFESQEVRILGIWGMGGIGKTTLARVICDKFSSRFESCCFMENVREASNKVNGLTCLLQKLFSGLLNEENININDLVKIRSIKRRLRRKKVIVVLDDIDTSEQLEYLAGEQLYLGLGSRVIITTRDKHVLNSGGVHAIHEIKGLNFQESLELFSLNAFNQSHPRMGYEKLSESAVFYAKGIPLALKVLGSYLHSKSKETWESALKKLQKYPNMQIQNVLKVSYDGLDDIEKDIFLDIAFFFKGGNKDDVITVLDACGFYATCGIDRLLDKALITISYDNKIQMHDLLQEMGEQIVREESVKHPERRSRLRDIEEVFDVLQNNSGTNVIEGLILDVSQVKNVRLSSDTFKKMPNLRILKMYSEPWCKESNVDVPFGLESFSNKLRYFHWKEYPLKSLPLGFCFENLIELHMQHSRVQKLWDGVQNLVNLKKINLSGSEQLIELPDLSMACNLETMQLTDCRSLYNFHPSIFSLQMLNSLDLMSCLGLESFRIIELCYLKSLKVLLLYDCKQVNTTELHIMFDALHSLETLHLKRCDNMSEIPDNIGALSLLKNLHIDESNVETLPSINHLSKLQNISLNFCNRLRSLPALPPFVKYLHVQYCSLLETVLPSTISILDHKEETFQELEFSFKECEKLDGKSLSNVMGFSNLSMVQAIYKKFSKVEACYPGSTVPKWFVYKAMTEASFTIELPAASNQLLGFVFCGVIPHQFLLSNVCEISFKILDSKDYTMRTCRVFLFQKLQRDHVYLWYRPFEAILRQSGRSNKYDKSITCKFTCTLYDESMQVKYASMITECGVCPIYASKLDNITEQILEFEFTSGSKTKRYEDIDDQEQLSLKLKESRTIESNTFHDVDDNLDELQPHLQTKTSSD